MATRKADKEGLLGDNQYGTRPLCSAEQPALVDESITDLYHTICHNLAKLQNNTTACYNRMVCNLASLCSRYHHTSEFLSTSN